MVPKEEVHHTIIRILLPREKEQKSDTAYLGIACRFMGFRQKGEKYWITLKSLSVSVSNGEGGQLERNETEREVSSMNLNEQENILHTYFGDFLADQKVGLDDLKHCIDIENNRRKITATKKFDNEYINEEKYEIVFDDVEYVNEENGNTYKEWQMEIELKSRAETRINMKSLTDALEREVEGISSISDSKYHRAVDFTN